MINDANNFTCDENEAFVVENLVFFAARQYAWIGAGRAKEHAHHEHEQERAHDWYGHG